jgi:hypothetical protein
MPPLGERLAKSKGNKLRDSTGDPKGRPFESSADKENGLKRWYLLLVTTICSSSVPQYARPKQEAAAATRKNKPPFPAFNMRLL